MEWLQEILFLSVNHNGKRVVLGFMRGVQHAIQAGASHFSVQAFESTYNHY